MIYNEREICQYLGIPSIPKKKWDGKQSFSQGCAIIKHDNDEQSYAVATFDNEIDDAPRIVKVFSLEQFSGISDIYIVPTYMDTNVDGMDLDEESKENAKFIIEEAREIELGEDKNDFADTDVPDNEYYFDNIHNDEQAKAFIRAYNKKNRIKRGAMPKTHEGLIVKLSVIYNEMNK